MIGISERGNRGCLQKEPSGVEKHPSAHGQHAERIKQMFDDVGHDDQGEMVGRKGIPFQGTAHDIEAVGLPNPRQYVADFNANWLPSSATEHFHLFALGAADFQDTPRKQGIRLEFLGPEPLQVAVSLLLPGGPFGVLVSMDV